MKETIRKRLEEKGHTDPDKALENFGVKVEQKGHPRFSNEGFMWYGNMITDPTKDETGTHTVDPRVYYATHYEQWLVWKARRDGKTPDMVTHEDPPTPEIIKNALGDMQGFLAQFELIARIIPDLKRAINELQTGDPAKAETMYHQAISPIHRTGGQYQIMHDLGDYMSDVEWHHISRLGGSS